MDGKVEQFETCINPKTIKAIGKPSSWTHLKNVLKLYSGIKEAYSEPYQTKWSFLRK